MARASQAVAQDFGALRRFVYDEDAQTAPTGRTLRQVRCTSSICSRVISRLACCPILFRKSRASRVSL
jgi:hypothetical protein